MVLDASAAVELLLSTTRGRRLAARLADGLEPLCAPHLIDLEVANALRRYVALGRLLAKAGEEALEQWRRLDVERHPHEAYLNRIWQLRDNVSPYDAAYVALAEALSTTLVTGDRRLAAAPGPRARIELV